MPIYEADTVTRITRAYERARASIAVARERLQRPLTLTEKILFAHMTEPQTQGLERGADYLVLQPDRVALQDVTAQMALLQFELAGLQRMQAPTTVHCDHLIQARVGATADLITAIDEHKEVYDFLESASARYGAGFWKPGSGIIHQVIFENYAFPGGLMIGTDSHTPNAGGLGMLAIGVGGADAVDVMAGLDWGVTMPKLIGVRLRGELSGWTSPKDVILRVADELTVKGGTDAIVEYFGPGVASLSATGRGTVTNMGAEVGATTSVFPFDEATARYLRATGREAIAELAATNAADLRADPGVEAQRHEIFDRVIELDLSTLEPAWVGPHTPDLRHTAGEIGAWAESQGYPRAIKDALIGSCTNSSYEDLSRAASLARQASAAGLTLKVPLLVTPGSEQVRATIERDGQIAAFEEIGATVLANACGPCIGQWKRDIRKGETNTIVTSFNRNFPARNDANPQTLAFIGSPEMVVATAFAGDLGFDPRTDAIPSNGGEFRFQPPTGDELPQRGYELGDSGFVPAREDGSGVEVVVDADSSRLQRLTPWTPWDGKDFEDCTILLKSSGKTTTDHISPAGPWLRFRGHLDNIADNTFIGVNNAFSPQQLGTGNNMLSGERGMLLPDIARAYKAAAQPWVVIGDENFGEGSSREHAAMQPRHLGCVAVLVRSFARIHETNLKKQGLLPLRLADPADYDKFGQEDRVSIRGLKSLAPGRPLTVEIRHPDGSTDSIEVTHSFTGDQVGWFRAGGALNEVATAQRKKAARRPPAKKAARKTAKKPVARKAAARKTIAAKKAPARKSVAKKSAAKKVTGRATRKAAAKKIATKATARKTIARRQGARKTVAKKALKRSAGKKGAKKAVKRGAKKSAGQTVRKAATRAPAKKAVKGAKGPGARKRTTRKTAATTRGGKAIRKPAPKAAPRGARKASKAASKRGAGKR